MAAYRKPAAANPDTYLLDVARVRWSMGRMHAGTDRDGSGGVHEALAVFQKFATPDPAPQRFVDFVKEDLAKLKP